MRTARTTVVALALVGLVGSGCSTLGSPPGRGGSRTEPRSGSSPALEPASPQDVARLRRVIEPLARAADKPPAQVRVGIISDRSINAANAGGGEFYVTRGLLDRASDEQLLAIMAHEFAHNDLGHVAKAQVVNAGVGIGAAILERVIPQAAIVTPIAGTLITRAHSRSEELEADRHAVTLLKRVGSSKQALENTLAWLQRTSGGAEGGGWFATHPGTTERIQALRQIP
jgi:Zn-dependent protease with chaperone function